MLFTPNSNPSPAYGLLIFGAFLILLAVIGTCTGELWARFGIVVYRDENPKEFWRSVATCYLLGIFLIVAEVFDLPRDFLLGVLFIGVFVYLVYLLVRSMIRQKQ
jgi:hypothetical protein